MELYFLTSCMLLIMDLFRFFYGTNFANILPVVDYWFIRFWMDAYIFKRKWNDICIGGFTRRSWYDSRVLVVIPLLSGGLVMSESGCCSTRVLCISPLSRTHSWERDGIQSSQHKHMREGVKHEDIFSFTCRFYCSYELSGVEGLVVAERNWILLWASFSCGLRWVLDL